MQFKQLPITHNAQGEIRKVGFELEFSQVGIEECVQIVQELYGGTVQREHRFSQKVVNTRLGDFSIEIDLKLLTEKKYKYIFDRLNIDLESIKVGQTTLEEKVENALEAMIRQVIPYEIGTPPLPCTHLEPLEDLRQALYEHHAQGTEASMTNAFGTHINPELPDTHCSTILRYLRAFLLLYPWLLKVGKTDFARLRMTSFINPYPAEYTALVLAPAYAPDLDTFIDDYHRYNPDRNRPLDLYPVLAFLNAEKVNGYTNLGSVKARNTFHYRLPNSRISDPDWRLSHEWNNWVSIEELANAPDQINLLSQAHLTLKKETLLGFDEKWIQQIEQWHS
ncbi:amidoligase [Rufibacter immobilis]|uniref:Amidoligase n=1 Tax=Rufibacter immobilis TaxID=1348778 RepID=A0A3M9MNX1_9BACT|nr:amidoligase family protein [Rufibacter immobilis]RNI27219.1 amidoligase [Rufibacter immobilis]